MNSPFPECYSETLDGSLQWQADAKDTFTEVANPYVVGMVGILLESSPLLSGLLCISQGIPQPYSFGERGFPQAASPEIQRIHQDFAEDSTIRATSYVTRAELEAKLGELMLLPDAQALAVLPKLQMLIKQIPETTTDSTKQRIVFWFT